MAHRLTIPGTTYIGENALADALADISALGKHALIVSGNSMKKAGHLEMLTARLRKTESHRPYFQALQASLPTSWWKTAQRFTANAVQTSS